MTLADIRIDWIAACYLMAIERGDRDLARDIRANHPEAASALDEVLDGLIEEAED